MYESHAEHALCNADKWGITKPTMRGVNNFEASSKINKWITNQIQAFSSLYALPHFT